MDPTPSRARHARPATASTSSKAPCAKSTAPTTVVYKTVPGVDANLLSLDIYPPTPACGVPVVMWVHGGGYSVGDKKNQVADKVRLFNEHGWMFVSVNYRLTRPGEAKSAQYPDHYEDVAAAVAWVNANIAEYGGDPSEIALLGHSAGADIVANVVTNPTYLAAVRPRPRCRRLRRPARHRGIRQAAGRAPTTPTGSRSSGNASLGNDPELPDRHVGDAADQARHRDPSDDRRRARHAAASGDRDRSSSRACAPPASTPPPSMPGPSPTTR